MSALAGIKYILIPHPDDEMQAWSLIENEPDIYKVFVILTRGEQTKYCAESGYDAGTGEQLPSPRPTDRWTSECEVARQNSFFNFIHAMSDKDKGLAASHTYAGTMGPFDIDGEEICRYDDADCIVDRTAEVWTSPRSTVIWFNLGDGDLTESEVSWAIKTIQLNSTRLGIPDALPSSELVGASYWNEHHQDCQQYDHGDHRAVRDVLWHTYFGLGPQIVATCGSDPTATVSEQVSHESFVWAFALDGTPRIGMHAVHYGWLFGGKSGSWLGDYYGQEELFHRNQTFRVRFGDK